MAEKPSEPTERVVPVEQPVPSPNERIEPFSERSSEKSQPAWKPAPGPIDQVPPPKPQTPAEDK